MTQDNYGAREDTLKALLLDPNDKSSIPLIARLFPGKTASELYHSDLANDLRPSLLPSKHQQSGLTESTSRASLLNKLLEELTIHTAEEEKEEMNGEKKESGKAGSGSAHSGTDNPPLTPPSPLQLPTSPRLFSVLNLPCPPLTDNNAVVPSLQECLKEDEFHQQICCAKKMVRQFMFVLLSILKLILYLPFHSAHKMFSGYFSTQLALHHQNKTTRIFYTKFLEFRIFM